MPSDEEVFCDEFKKECTQKVNILKRTFVYNPSSLGVFVGITAIILSEIIGSLQEMSHPEWDELYPIDVWSISHFVISFGLMVLLTSFIGDKKKAFLYTTLIVVIFEPIEWALSLVTERSGLFYEFIWNRIFDIPIDLLGIGLGYRFAEFFICKNNNSVKNNK